MRIESISGDIVTFSTNKSKLYGDDGGDSNIGIGSGQQRVMLQRVPNYHNVTVNGTINFYPSDWNGTKNGVMFFRASGAVSVNGTIHANAKGYVGGIVQTVAYGGGYGGEAFCGAGGTGSTTGTAGAGGGGGNSGGGGLGYCGGGGGGNLSTNYGLGSLTKGGAGGGGGTDGGGNTGGGGGGGYGTAGAGGNRSSTAAPSGGDGYSGNGGNAVAGGGGGGGSYGEANLATKLMFGSAGASGGMYYAPGAGGDGGGIVYIAANSLSVNSALQSNGANGSNGACTTSYYSGGGGGGAGGSVKLVGNTLSLGTNFVTASAGTGGSGCHNGSSANNYGGVGGTGRIATYYSTSLAGTTLPTTYSSSTADNSYSIFISDEMATPNATDYNKIKWLADNDTYGMVQFETRSGATPNSTDNTWEAWRAATTSGSIPQKLSLQTANNSADWIGTNAYISGGVIQRNVNFFEDEDESTANNATQLMASTSAGYADAIISAADLRNYDYISAWFNSTASGGVVKLGFGESSPTEHEQTFTIDAPNTWQKVYWDIHSIPREERNGVRNLRITAIGYPNTVHFDNINAEKLLNNSSGSTINSTPNEYIQYRAIMTSTNPGYHPKIKNVQVEWNNGFKMVQSDDNSVRLYNYTGEIQDIKLEAIVFGADLAEWYTVDDTNIGPGDLVALTGRLDDQQVPVLRKASGISDPNLAGVISTKAGQTLGLESAERRLLALAGRVPLKMDPDSPAVSAGDLLTSSDIPGLARKARPGDKTVAKALENWGGNGGTDTILGLVNNSSYKPSLAELPQFLLTKVTDNSKVEYQVVTLTGDRVENVDVLAKAVVGNLQAGLINAQEVIADNLTVTTKLVSPIAEIGNLKTNLISPLASDSAILVDGSLNVTDNATVSGVLYADNIEGDTINGILGSLGSLDTKYSSAAAILADIRSRYGSYNQLVNPDSTTDPLDTSTLTTANASISGDLDLNNLNVRASLLTNSINSSTTDLYIQPLNQSAIHLLADLMTLYPDGRVIVNGDLYLNGGLFAQNLTTHTATISGSFGKLLALYNENGDLVGSIDSSGSADFNELITKQLIIANASSISTPSAATVDTNSTIGTAIIPANQTSITIATKAIDASTLIYLTPLSDTANQVLYVRSKEEGTGFTVAINSPVTQDIKFNYWLIKTR